MKVRKEIERYASKKDKPILHRLLTEYSLESQWKFVAKATKVRYGKLSYEVYRVWEPTFEGKVLYEALIKKDNAKGEELAGKGN